MRLAVCEQGTQRPLCVDERFEDPFRRLISRGNLNNIELRFSCTAVCINVLISFSQTKETQELGLSLNKN